MTPIKVVVATKVWPLTGVSAHVDQGNGKIEQSRVLSQSGYVGYI